MSKNKYNAHFSFINEEINEYLIFMCVCAQKTGFRYHYLSFLVYIVELHAALLI